MSIDSFNPYQSKQAKQVVSVTGIYLVCLNLPPHLRYLPENLCLVGIIPGPHKPSLDQINHFLKPLVEELLVFWETGVYFTQTAKYAAGRLVRCALIPLVCDLPAARQVAGFGAHNAKFFCSLCKLTIDQISEIDTTKWPLRSCEEHKAAAAEWRDKPTDAQRDAAFQTNSIRWSELLALPYWDPIQYTVIDSMHNHYLGLIQRHCRKIWGMQALVEDNRSVTEPFRPPDEDLALGWAHLYGGTEHELGACKATVLRYLCFTLDLPYRKLVKNQLRENLLDWVSLFHVPAERSS